MTNLILKLFAVFCAFVDAKLFNYRFFFKQHSFGVLDTTLLTLAIGMAIFALWYFLAEAILYSLREKNKYHKFAMYAVGFCAIMYLSFSAMVSNSVMSKDRADLLSKKVDTVKIDSTAYYIALQSYTNMVQNPRYSGWATKTEEKRKAIESEAYRLSALRASRIEKLTVTHNAGLKGEAFFLSKYTGVFTAILTPAWILISMLVRIQGGETKKPKSFENACREYALIEKSGDIPESMDVIAEEFNTNKTKVYRTVERYRNMNGNLK